MANQVSHRKVLISCGMAVVIMFGFCFAMVPLYSMLCKATGLNTSVRSAELISPALAGTLSQSSDLSREITVQFVAQNHMGMSWDFYPLAKSVRVHPGEKTQVFFYAKNTTDHAMTVQAIPSMTPPEVISHFHKIECFCFKQQSLAGLASRKMALVFQIDKEVPKEIHVVTLSYTLFDVTPKTAAKRGHE